MNTQDKIRHLVINYFPAFEGEDGKRNKEALITALTKIIEEEKIKGGGRWNMEKDLKNAMEECYRCIHRREIPGDAHSRCVKPDPDMTGNPHGIKHGWFFYPFNFDPIWKTKDCSNYQTSEAISDAVSPENDHT